MGSLVPGWNEDVGAVPKELQEFDETDEGPKGYFAKLRSMRGMRQSLESPSTPSPTTTTALSKCQSERVPSLTRRSLEHPKQPRAELGRLSARYTGPSVDWEEELATLRSPKRGSLARYSMGSTGHHEEHSAGWWSSLDHGALNTPVEETSAEERDAAVKGSFVPQFHVTGTNLN